MLHRTNCPSHEQESKINNRLWTDWKWDQLIANSHISAVKDKLLLEEDLTLDKALTFGCHVEGPVQNAWNKCFQIWTRPAKTLALTPPQSQRKQASESQQHNSGYRCGSNKHLANHRFRPAAKVKCSCCGKKGHCANVCRAASNPTPLKLIMDRSSHLPPMLILLQKEGSKISERVCISLRRTDALSPLTECWKTA